MAWRESVDAVGARLARLRQLSLQSNRLTSMAGLGACSALEELYLSHNGITRIEVAPLPVSPPIGAVCTPGRPGRGSSAVTSLHVLPLWHLHASHNKN